MKIHILMILDCFEEGDHFESNKIETSGVSIKSVSFLFCRYRNSSSDIAARTAFKHDLSKHFPNSDMGLHIELYFRDAEFVHSRERVANDHQKSSRVTLWILSCCHLFIFGIFQRLKCSARTLFLLTLWFFDVILKLTHIYKGNT